MDFAYDFKPTSTISVDPPGGTHRHSHPHQSQFPAPLPTDTFPSATARYIHATKSGENALWVVFVIMTLGLLGVGVLSLRVEKRARVFHWISAGVLTIAMVSYLVMATGLGVSYVPIHEQAKGGTVHFLREVYYARYIDWLFTTPLLLLSLALLAGLSPADTLMVVLADIFMIVTGLFAGVVPSRLDAGQRSRWLFYAISCIAFLGIFVTLYQGGRKAAAMRPRKTRGLFWLLSAMTFALWTAYPIVFALTEGANKVGVDAEIIAYGVLDVAAKVGFTFLLLMIHSHGEEATWTLPEWFVEPRQGTGGDGRGTYGSLRNGDE
ncbi:hypothetical protein P7C73_g47, partial [Tremellales sp. Uapishka_1]